MDEINAVVQDHADIEEICKTIKSSFQSLREELAVIDAEEPALEPAASAAE